MITSVSRPVPGISAHDDEVMYGFAPQCPSCSITTQPHGTRNHAWWRCPSCALPVLG